MDDPCRHLSAAPATWSLSGEPGLRRLGRARDLDVEVDVDVDEPALFRASLTRTSLGSAVTVDEMRFTAVRSASSRRVPTAGSQIAVLLPVEGRLHISRQHERTTVGPGEAVIVDRGIRSVFESDDDVRLLRAVVRLDEPTPDLLRDHPASPRTALADGYVAFLRAVVARHDLLRAMTPPLSHALEGLTLGVIGEASAPRAPAREPLRPRIEGLIERRFPDPALSAATIAVELGVSVRHVHNLFRPSGIPVGRLIEERRLRAVAMDLREVAIPEASADLAARWGFGGADQLRRAFRRRYGVSLGEYRRNSDRYRT